MTVEKNTYTCMLYMYYTEGFAYFADSKWTTELKLYFLPEPFVDSEPSLFDLDSGT